MTTHLEKYKYQVLAFAQLIPDDDCETPTEKCANEILFLLERFPSYVEIDHVGWSDDGEISIFVNQKIAGKKIYLDIGCFGDDKYSYYATIYVEADKTRYIDFCGDDFLVSDFPDEKLCEFFTKYLETKQ